MSNPPKLINLLFVALVLACVSLKFGSGQELFHEYPENKCIVNKTVTEVNVVSVEVEYVEQKYEFSWTIPPWNLVDYTVYRQENVTEERNVTKPTVVCCEGYSALETYNPGIPEGAIRKGEGPEDEIPQIMDYVEVLICVPECYGLCGSFGKCVAPEVCDCPNIGIMDIFCPGAGDNITDTDEETTEEEENTEDNGKDNGGDNGEDNGGNDEGNGEDNGEDDEEDKGEEDYEESEEYIEETGEEPVETTVIVYYYDVLVNLSHEKVNSTALNHCLKMIRKAILGHHFVIIMLIIFVPLIWILLLGVCVYFYVYKICSKLREALRRNENQASDLQGLENALFNSQLEFERGPKPKDEALKNDPKNDEKKPPSESDA